MVLGARRRGEELKLRERSVQEVRGEVGMGLNYSESETLKNEYCEYHWLD